MQQVNWHLGQALLPEHFSADQQYTTQQGIALCNINCPTEYFGLAELTIDDFCLTKNILKINSLLYVSATGTCIKYDSNTSKALEINLNALEEESACVALNMAEEDVTSDIKYSDKLIQTKSPNLSLEINPESTDEINTFTLMKLVKHESGKWELNNFLPPLLTTNVYTFKIVIDKLNEVMHTINSYLDHERATNSSLSSAKFIQLQQMEFSLNFLQIQLNQLNSNKLHPYHIFQNIIPMYIYLLQYQNGSLSDENLIYYHNRPWRGFTILFDSILSRVQYTHSIEYKSFKPIDDILTTETIEYEALNRKKHYLVIRKPTESFIYHLSTIKLTSPERIDHINQYSLVGLKLKKLTFNPLPGSGIDKFCDVYEILPSREWDYIMAEQKIALSRTQAISNLKFTYYYV